MGSTRVQNFRHEGVTFTIIEKLEPASLRNFFDSSKELSGLSRNLAKDIYTGGGGRMTLEADRPNPNRYNLTLEVDLRQNPEFIRSMDLTQVANRLSAAVGAAHAELPTERDDEVKKNRFGPPPSFLGDCFRGLGAFIGLGIDMLIDAIFEGFRRLRGEPEPDAALKA